MTMDELVEKARAAYNNAAASSKPVSAAMRAALEAVLPDIERPLRRRLAGVEDDYERTEAELARIGALLVERDKEIERLRGLLERAEQAEAEKVPWSLSMHHMAERLDEAEALLVERDKEIEGLRAQLSFSCSSGECSCPYPTPGLDDIHRGCGLHGYLWDELAERSFPPDEIEALLEHTDALNFPKEWRALRSARARLEKMRDE